MKLNPMSSPLREDDSPLGRAKYMLLMGAREFNPELKENLFTGFSVKLLEDLVADLEAAMEELAGVNHAKVTDSQENGT